jgi:Flp pilus assembly protein TadB
MSKFFKEVEKLATKENLIAAGCIAAACTLAVISIKAFTISLLVAAVFFLCMFLNQKQNPSKSDQLKTAFGF